ncbi:MAG TPA: hypothetical protein PKI34_13240 [Bacteroidales bacterium]|nr:hypothetical protein [Bacteroidales bacterium]
MKYLFSILISGIILTACSTTSSLTYSEKVSDDAPKKYTNIGVLAVLKSNDARINIENAVTEMLRSKGYPANYTWDVWPFANNLELMKKHGIEGDKIKEMLQQRVISQKMDALLIITLFDAVKEQRYVPGSGVSVGVAVNPGMYPVYAYPYYSYYGYAFNTISDPGYYVESSTYFTESNLYDIVSEQLIWTGQMSTKLESSLETEAQKFSEVLISGMIKDKIFAQ